VREEAVDPDVKMMATRHQDEEGYLVSVLDSITACGIHVRRSESTDGLAR
jgi:hypothetical protein